MKKSIFVLVMPLFFLYADMEKPIQDTTAQIELKERNIHTNWNREESVRSRDKQDGDREKIEAERDNRLQKTMDERDKSANTAS
jgi:predicted Holliday junction resolvase-like endonuclease